MLCAELLGDNFLGFPAYYHYLAYNAYDNHYKADKAHGVGPFAQEQGDPGWGKHHLHGGQHTGGFAADMPYAHVVEGVAAAKLYNAQHEYHKPGGSWDARYCLHRGGDEECEYYGGQEQAAEGCGADGAVANHPLAEISHGGVGKAGTEGNEIACHGDPFALRTHEEYYAYKQHDKGPCAMEKEGFALFALRKVNPDGGGELNAYGHRGAGHADGEYDKGALAGKGNEQQQRVQVPVYLFYPQEGQQHQSADCAPEGGQQQTVHRDGLQQYCVEAEQGGAQQR